MHDVLMIASGALVCAAVFLFRATQRQHRADLADAQMHLARLTAIVGQLESQADLHNVDLAEVHRLLDAHERDLETAARVGHWKRYREAE